ncbi:MAG: competence/damage-inducible protein A [Alphaproteobacteria bacterium]|nr:competence/damage-inducible protein A [Alphaproteobacteria bacterium]
MSYFDDPDIFKAAVIVVGNEILSGRTKDANISWIAEKMNLCGVVLTEVRIVPDIEACIVEAVNALRPQVDYVFTTGGIGPTHDDITAASVTKALGLELEYNARALAALLDHYGEAELTDARKKMAQMPVGAVLIPNPVSGAPGFAIENVYVMAGVPRIMQAMLDHIIREHLEEGKKVLSNTIACDLPESEVAASLDALQQRYTEVDIGSYPHFRSGKLGLSLVLRGVDDAALKVATEAVVDMVRECGGTPQALGLEVLIDNF